MATIKITASISVEDIYCTVTCPQCEKTVRMRMKKPITRKNCPGCNRLTYAFAITQLRGYVVVSAITIGDNFAPTPYDLKPDDVEIQMSRGEE